MPFGCRYQFKCTGYRGDPIGICTLNLERKANFVDVDYFHDDFENRIPESGNPDLTDQRG